MSLFLSLLYQVSKCQQVYNVEEYFLIVPVSDLVPLHHPLRKGRDEHQLSADLRVVFTHGLDLPPLIHVDIKTIDL